MNKLVSTAAALVCFVLALVFILVPGPSILFTLLGLFLLSLHYPGARRHLKKCQRGLSAACAALDRRIAKK